ncbi:MAG: hypothetical protein D3926_21215 [Desulfobacteraceae bacterium]|nr:MAG: hypothetical protein D3926_21215 [Desulfobacteraceae bacterium]
MDQSSAQDLQQGVMLVVGIITLCSVYASTAYSFLKYRIPKKRREYERVRKLLGLALETTEGDAKEEEEDLITRIFQDEFRGVDYVLPVTFVTVFTILGLWVLFSGKTPLILSGIFDLSDCSSKKDLLCYSRLSLLAIGMAVLGAYVWSLQYIVRRLINMDLAPNAFYSIGTRMVLATFTSVVLYHLIQSFEDPIKNEMIGNLPALAFLTGMFPQRILKFIQEKTLSMMPSETKASPLPLTMIEGMTLFNRVRLAELNIDNAQNLANANIRELIVRTPFNPLLIFDWLTQAKLYIYAKKDITALRKAAIRTNFDLIHAQRRGDLSQVADVSGIELKRLEMICHSVEEDLKNSFLETVRTNLTKL